MLARLQLKEAMARDHGAVWAGHLVSTRIYHGRPYGVRPVSVLEVAPDAFCKLNQLPPSIFGMTPGVLAGW